MNWQYSCVFVVVFDDYINIYKLAPRWPKLTTASTVMSPSTITGLMLASSFYLALIAFILVTGGTLCLVHLATVQPFDYGGAAT